LEINRKLATISSRPCVRSIQPATLPNERDAELAVENAEALGELLARFRDLVAEN
jgi:hypothetical protein